jgi:hypothetical protein
MERERNAANDSGKAVGAVYDRAQFWNEHSKLKELHLEACAVIDPRLQPCPCRLRHFFHSFDDAQILVAPVYRYPVRKITRGSHDS